MNNRNHNNQSAELEKAVNERLENDLWPAQMAGRVKKTLIQRERKQNRKRILVAAAIAALLSLQLLSTGTFQNEQVQNVQLLEQLAPAYGYSTESETGFIPVAFNELVLP